MLVALAITLHTIWPLLPPWHQKACKRWMKQQNWSTKCSQNGWDVDEEWKWRGWRCAPLATLPFSRSFLLSCVCVCFLRFCFLLLASAIPVGVFSSFPPTNECQVRSLGWSQRRSVYAREMHNPDPRNQLKMQSWWHWFGAFSAHLGSCFFGLGTQHCLAGPLLRRWPLDLLPLIFMEQ